MRAEDHESCGGLIRAALGNPLDLVASGLQLVCMGTHDDEVLAQFATKADLFATAPALTDESSLQLLLAAAGPKPMDTALDVACGAGLVACAFAPHVRHVTGIDLVPAMIDRARALAAEKQLINLSWHVANVRPLPFPSGTFSIVTCRYALHHFGHPQQVLAEMERVCAHGGRVVVADMAASSDPAKAAALNQMEQLRDPSHVRTLSVAELAALFGSVGLIPTEPRFYRLDFELEALLKGSHPHAGNELRVRELFEESLGNDSMDLQVSRQPDGIHLRYNIVVLKAEKG